MAMLWITLSLLVCVPLVTGAITNIALNKPARQSAKYGDDVLPPGGAVDGVITTKYPGIIHTALGQRSAWWMVDLQTLVQDATVKIYFRTDFNTKRNGVQFYTSTTPFSSYPEGELCHTVTGRADGTDIPDVVSVKCTGTWRYLLVYTRTENEKGFGPALDFGEVEVLGCDGTYGDNCDKSCGKCAVTPTSCDRYTGACPTGGCKPGWMGTDCARVCSSGTYSSNCDKSCSSRQCAVTPTTCDRYTGACPAGGCKPGWMGTDCTQACIYGAYGPGCRLSCGDRKCTNPYSSCDHVTGQCVRGCQKGWNGADCTQECLSGTYGDMCNQLCSGRHCVTPSGTCNHVNGTCPEGGCEDGWMGIDCSQECVSGTYGPNCANSCSARQCRTPSDTCDRQTGRCPDGCQHGWRGENCSNACPNGTYGLGCDAVCGQCSSDDICNHVTGNCPGDCQQGWEGTFCEQKSQSGLDQTAVIAGSVTTVVIVILILVTIGVVVWRRRKRQDMKTKNDPEHTYYDATSGSVKVKDEGSEVGDSLPEGHYASVGDYLEPVPERTYEKLNPASRGQENDYTGFERSYENVKQNETST